MVSISARRKVGDDRVDEAAATSGPGSRLQVYPRDKAAAAGTSPRLTSPRKQPSYSEIKVTPFSPTHLSPTEEHHRSPGKFEIRSSSSSQSLHAAFTDLSLSTIHPSHQRTPLLQSPKHVRSSIHSNVQEADHFHPHSSTSATSSTSSMSSSTTTTRNKLPSIQTTFENGKPTAPHRASEALLDTPATSAAALRSVRGPLMTPKTSQSVHYDSPNTSTTLTTPSSIGLRQPFHFSPARQYSEGSVLSPATSFAESTDLHHDFTSIGGEEMQCEDGKEAPSYRGEQMIGIHAADTSRMPASQNGTASSATLSRSVHGGDLGSSSSGVLDATNYPEKEGLLSSDDWRQYRQEDKPRLLPLPPAIPLGNGKGGSQPNGVGRGGQESGRVEAAFSSVSGSDGSATSSLLTVTTPIYAQQQAEGGQCYTTTDRSAELIQSTTVPSLKMLSASPERLHTLPSSHLAASLHSTGRIDVDSRRTPSLLNSSSNTAPTPSKLTRPGRPMLARLNTSEAVKKSTGNTIADATRKQSLSASRLTVNTAFGAPRSATLSEGFLPVQDLSLEHSIVKLRGASIFTSPEATTNDSTAESRPSTSYTRPGQSGATITSSFEPSIILDGFLYLGPDIATSSELNYLKETWGVKRILNAAYEVEDHLSLNSATSGIERYERIPMRDTVEAKGVQEDIEKACAFIDDARLHSAPVYVHCKAGKSRSVLLVMAYLIHANRWSLPQAYSYVVERRRTVSPNIGFVAELMTFEQRRLHPRSRTTSRLEIKEGGKMLRGASKWPNRDSLPTSSSMQPISMSFWDHLAITQQKNEGSEVQRLAKGSAGADQKPLGVTSLKEHRGSDGRYHPARPPADEKRLISPWRASMAAIDSEHFFGDAGGASEKYI